VVGSPLVQTIFHFDPREHLELDGVYIHLEPGGHRPSPEEDLFAPFYPDPSKRVLAVDLRGSETLLTLAREWGGEALEWEQWNAHGIDIRCGRVVAPWVSGPRLFCISWVTVDPQEMEMEIYDFSVRENVGYLRLPTDVGGAGQRPMWPRAQEPRILWDVSLIYFAGGGHDSIALLAVRTPSSLDLTRV